MVLPARPKSAHALQRLTGRVGVDDVDPLEPSGQADASLFPDRTWLVHVLVGIFVGIAMLIALAGAVFHNVKIWGLVRDSRRSFREPPPNARRRVLWPLAVTYLVVLGVGAVVVIAPFGVRRTLTYFIVVPFLFLVPVMVIAAGIRGFRGQRRERPPEA